MTAAAQRVVTMGSGEQYVRPAIMLVWTWDECAQLEIFADPLTGRPPMSKSAALANLRSLISALVDEPEPPTEYLT